LLSATGASLAATPTIESTLALKSSLSTAIAGSNVVFTATVENASNDAPIDSGKVKFTVESPKQKMLGNVGLNKHGQASNATTQLTQIASYQVKAQFIPSSPSITKSAAAPVSVKVIPVPLNVPTKTVLYSGAKLAEVGQHVPLVAVVTDAGTGVEVNAGKVEPLTGTVAFLTDSPTPIVLGEATLNNGRASLSTSTLRALGTYQVYAIFLPANNYYAESTAAPLPVTITPLTVNAPTTASIQAVQTSIERGEPFTFTVTTQNSDSSLADGVVQLRTAGRRPTVLGEANVSSFGQQISFLTSRLQEVGTYQVEAEYLPNTNRFARSTAGPITVTITPLVAARFRVTPVIRRGHLNKPVSFNVTALNVRNRPVTDYTDTVAFSSPTDSWTILPRGIYVSLKITPPPPQSTGLATFANRTYTFTPADHGTHTFYGGVTFKKGGAEVLKVVQTDNPKVFGKATFAIS
jgi:hypothetical protein